MNYSRFRLARLFAAVFLVCLAIVAHIALSSPKGVQAASSSTPLARTSRPTIPTGLYKEAARALRQDKLQEARQHLGTVAEQNPKEAERAHLLEALYAAETGDTVLAQELLAEPAGDDRSFEDWRLFLLAESALENGDRDAAVTALDRLLASCPDSPLRPEAYIQAARLSQEDGEERRTLTLIEGARREGLSGKIAVELENLAWEIGHDIHDDEVRREAGRRLLTRAPLTAGALGVADTFRAMDGGNLDWNRILSTSQVKQRARSFLSVERLSAALDTLDNVPAAERDVEWHLIRAEVLTGSGQSQNALDMLASVPARSREERAGVEWARALATARLAGSRDKSGDRQARLEAAHRHLANAVRLGIGDGAELSKDSLENLYDDFLEAGLFPQAVDALKMLRHLDPGDTTGARDLWERGWTRYGKNDYRGAVSFWSELAEIYPEHGDAQRGRYWQARALEKLGQPEEARDIYSDMIASSDTSDFYGRRAIARLGVPPVSSEIQLARTQSIWPSDPTLERAKLLSDFGLDELAKREMELVEDEANARDLRALRAVVMGRQGKRRESIALLRQAFPALGGPQQSTVPEEILRAYYPLDYEDTIVAAAKANGLPAYLVAGIIRQESAFDPRATSPVGAKGLMQIMPATGTDMASRLNVRYPADGLYDPEFSIELGAAYIKQLLNGFDGNVELAVAGYNGGPNRIRRLWNEAGPTAELDDFVENLYLEESRDYVKRILVLADSYRQLYPSIG